MKTIRKKANAAAIVITLVLVLPIVTPAFAQLDPSYAFVAVRPKTVGLGETILVMGWTSPQPILIGTDLSGFGQGRPRHNYTFTFTDPDGSTDTVIGGPSFGDGTVFLTYVPNKLGDWEVTLYWPGNEIYAASTSPPFNFAVQDDPLPEWPASPLPTEWNGTSIYQIGGRVATMPPEVVGIHILLGQTQPTYYGHAKILLEVSEEATLAIGPTRVVVPVQWLWED